MTKINKNEKITLVYKNNKIVVTGKTLHAVLSISADELKRIYWGMIGEGFISLDVEYEAPQEVKNA